MVVGTGAEPARTAAQRAMDARDWTFEGTWPYEPRWLHVDGVRLHYVDEGPRGATTELFLHGVPWWSYAFRAEIAAARDAGRRAVAYDRLGFGRSDKPARESEYSPERDRAHLEALVAEAAIVAPLVVAQRSAEPLARRVPGAAAVRLCDEPPLPDAVHAPLLGRLLVKGARLPVRRAPLDPLERQAYLAPHPSWESRSGIVAALRSAR